MQNHGQCRPQSGQPDLTLRPGRDRGSQCQAVEQRVQRQSKRRVNPGKLSRRLFSQRVGMMGMSMTLIVR